MSLQVIVTHTLVGYGMAYATPLATTCWGYRRERRPALLPPLLLMRAQPLKGILPAVILQLPLLRHIRHTTTVPLAYHYYYHTPIAIITTHYTYEYAIATHITTHCLHIALRHYISLIRGFTLRHYLFHYAASFIDTLREPHYAKKRRHYEGWLDAITPLACHIEEGWLLMAYADDNITPQRYAIHDIRWYCYYAPAPRRRH